MKKYMKMTLWCIVAAAGLLLLTALSGFLWSFRLQEVKTVSGDMKISGDAKVGLPVIVSQDITLPLREKIKKIEVTPGKGSVVSGVPETACKRYLWSRYELTVSQKIVPVIPGNIGSGSVKVIFRNSAVKPLEWAIPPFDAAALTVTPGSELQLAGAMELEKRFDYRYLWIGLGLAVIAVGLYLWMKRRSKLKNIPVPPWKRAMEKLEQLRFELRQRRVQPEQGFARLTDVVRDYIEERFLLPASRKTTAEFLEYLSDNNPLPEAQRPFLSDFLSVADQVKFAKATPDAILLDQAIDSAGILISSTGEPEEEKEVKNV